MSLKGFTVLLVVCCFVVVKIKSNLGVHPILGDYKMPTYCQNILRKRKRGKKIRHKHSYESLQFYICFGKENKKQNTRQHLNLGRKKKKHSKPSEKRMCSLGDFFLFLAVWEIEVLLSESESHHVVQGDQTLRCPCLGLRTSGLQECWNYRSGPGLPCLTQFNFLPP